ncbi:MAG: DUF2854 domain-containing protein [Cyanobacteria bacterium P01_A01_bin.105]
MLRKIPLGGVLLVVGGVLTLVGFVAYFQERATLNLVGFFYGVPILLGGLALRAAELEPVPYSQAPSEAVLALREKEATQTQNQVRQDVMRYRYGQEAHLDIALERLGMSPNDRVRPELVALREEMRDGSYSLVLEFESPFMEIEKWHDRHEKIEKFFGPGIKAVIEQPQEERVDLALITSAVQPIEAVSS